MKNRTHRGTDFRDFLKEEGILQEVEAIAWKRDLAVQIQQLRKKNALTKSQMAQRMRTSRAALDRLLDASNPSMTLATLEKAARVLGRKIKVELLPA
jgi:antitoxin HicB